MRKYLHQNCVVALTGMPEPLRQTNTWQITLKPFRYSECLTSNLPCNQVLRKERSANGEPRKYMNEFLFTIMNKLFDVYHNV